MPKQKQSSPRTFPTADTGPAAGLALSRVAALLAIAGERLTELQDRASDVVLSEIALRHQEMLNSCQLAAEMFSWPYLSPGNGQRMLALSREWLEVVTEAQAALLEATLVSGLPFGQSLLLGAMADQPPLAERRTRSVVISFPDRRLAA